MSEVLIAGWRFKALVASVLVAAGGYLLVALYSGWDAVLHAVARIGLGGIAAALCMSLINYLLRFVRWQMYLKALGHKLPWLTHWRIYLSGLALTTTPGKAGEAVRSVFLKRFGVDYTQSLAAMLSERLSDLVAVVILSMVGLSLYPQAHTLVLAASVGVAVGLTLLAQQSWLQRLAQQSANKAGQLWSAVYHGLHLLLQARRCHSAPVLLAATLLSLAAWGSEALAFHWITIWLGLDVSLRFAVFVYAVSMLAGAVSVMPGGLGGAEAAMVALLLFKGAPMADAVAATIIIRLATLWFAVGLGMIALSSSSKQELPA